MEELMDILNIFKRGKTVVKNEKVDVDPKEMSKEVGRHISIMWDNLAKGVYNPDDIGIDTYKYMFRTDSQIKAAYSLITLAVLSRKWKVSALDKKEEVVNFIKYNFEHVDGRISGALSQILSAIIYGFSVTEIVWKLIDDKEYRGKIGLKKLKTLDPETIEFKVDELGNLEGVVQNFGDNETVELPLQKTIIYSENKEFGNYYGNSRLRSIYKNWFIKETLTKFWNIALERWGQPIIVGTVPSTDDLDKMINILNNLQNKSAIAKTEGWELGALETGIGRSSGGDYNVAIDYHNREITKGMLVPGLMIESTKGGSYALGQTQFDVFMLMIHNIENDLCGMIENYLIRPLVEYNFGEQESYPEFRFEPITKQDLFNMARTFAILVKNGVISPDEQWMRDMMSLPRQDISEAGPNTVKESKTKQKSDLPPAQTQVRIVKDGSQQVKTPKLVADGLTKKEPRG
jgi:phage gp29-like protein